MKVKLRQSRSGVARVFAARFVVASGVMVVLGASPVRAQDPTPEAAPTPTAAPKPTPTPKPTPVSQNELVVALRAKLTEFGNWSHWKAVRDGLPVAVKIDGQAQLLSGSSNIQQVAALQAMTETFKSHPIQTPGWYSGLVNAAQDAKAPDQFPAETSSLAALKAARDAVAGNAKARNFGLNLVKQAQQVIDTFESFRVLFPLGEEAAKKNRIEVGVALAAKTANRLVEGIEVPDALKTEEISADSCREWLAGDAVNSAAGGEPGQLQALSTALRSTRGLRGILAVLKGVTTDLPSETLVQEDVASAQTLLLPPGGSNGTDTSKLTAISNRLAALKGENGYLPIVRADADARIPKLIQFVLDIRSGKRLTLEANSVLRPNAAVVGQIAGIPSDWAQLKAAAGGEAGLQKSIRLVEAELKPLLSSQQGLFDAVQLAQETVEGDPSKWVAQQVRLFYFGDVRNLLGILNPSIETLNGEDSAAALANATALRKKLRDSDANLASALGELNDARSRVLTIREEIRQARADQKNKKLLLQRATKLYDQLKDPNGADGQQAIAQLANQKAAATAETESQNRLTDLLDENTGLSEREDTALTRLKAAQQAVLKLRRESAPLSEDEVEAFARARDLRAMWRTRIQPDSRWPSQKIRIYAFDDSKTLFLYGLPKDVQATQNIIAGFDRPAPQARITLWTMQLNSGDPNAMNKSLSRIDSDLRNLRGNVTLVQDLLRNSINKEVNRQERIAHQVSQSVRDGLVNAPKTAVYEERIARYFFYPKEIRQPLGLPGSLPDVPEELTIAADELETSLQYFQRAREKNRAAKGYKNSDDKRQKGSDRNDLLRFSGYHLRQGLFALERLQTQEEKFPSLFESLQLNDLEIRRDISMAFVVQITALIQKGESDDNAYAELLDDPLKFQKIAVPIYEAYRKKLGDQLPKMTLSDGFDKFAGETLTKFKTVLRNVCKIVPGTPLSVPPTPGFPDDPRLTKGLLSPAEVQQADAVTRFTLPDPAQGTTLGEMLFILSLGKRRARERVMDNFQLALRQAYNAAGGSRNKSLQKLLTFTESLDAAYGDADEPGQSSARRSTLYPNFPRTVMGAFRSKVAREGDNHEMTSNQLEVFTAINTKARANCAAEVRRLLRELDKFSKNLADPAAQLIRCRYLPLAQWLSNQSLGSFIGSQIDSEAAPTTSADSYALPAFAQKFAFTERVNSRSKFRRSVSTAERNFEKWLTELDRFSDSDLIAMDRAAWTIATQEADLNSLARATPRVAAADDMIKRFIIVTEDDLEHFFFEGAIEDLRKNLPGGVQLGALQRESILATNRLVARVDPSASADVELDQATDFLQESTQLALLAQGLKDEKKSQSLTAGLTTAAVAKIAGNTASKSFGLGGLVGLLSALTAQPRQPAGEVYSINSGNVFKVTPIFDPSGQALRFKFDFTSSVRIQEPDGSVSRAIPRVERHSVNTEVQLSNLEIREISRFENNAKLGIPKKKTGGVPFLRTLPIIKEIPLLGFFTKEGGSKAVSQQSLILAQTTVYPTVSEIIDLMVAEPPHIDLDPTQPDYLEVAP